MRATCEQSLYRTVVKDTRDSIRQHFTTTNNETLSSRTNNAALSSTTNNAALSSLPGTVFSPPPPGSYIPSGSGPACVHYSFDFAQQVHYPHNPLQPGPMYFKTARKCAIFGVCCEGLPRQINYLIDEASDTGKGANTVVSLVHHFLEHHSLGETHIYMQTTVPGRIRTIPFYNTAHGGYCPVSTSQSPCPSCWLDTPSLLLTGASDC